MIARAIAGRPATYCVATFSIMTFLKANTIKNMTPQRKNTKTALKIGAIALAMLGLTYASFPLYNLFCKVTGYGGTPQQVDENSQTQGENMLTVRFNADTDPALAWKFKPLQKQVQVKTGENKLIFYEAENVADKAITGMATYNITPERAAYYFSKVQCFCFEQQTLQPHEKVEMPVSFYIDPEIEEDPDTRNIDTVTLSYTFFVAKEE